MNRRVLFIVPLLAAVFAVPSRAQAPVVPYADCGLEPPGTEWGTAPAPRPHELPFVAPGEPPRVRRESRPLLRPLHFGAASPKLRTGALSGKAVYVSAGHGYYGPGAWTTQRGVNNGIVEDLVSAETVSQFLVPMLVNAGAYVVTTRELDFNTGLNIVDDADADYTEVGPAETFSTSSLQGYGAPPVPIPNGTNIFTLGANRLMEAAVGTTPTASAEYVFTVPEDGNYDVFISYTQFSYRVPDAHFVVKHAGGESHFRVNQRRHGSTWVFLGRFYFRQGKDPQRGALVALNDASVTGNVSLDAVRIGGGRGLIAASGDTVTSGRPRFEECARYHIQYSGAPSSVYDSATLSDRNDDVSARSKFTAWDHEAGEDAVYVAWHTNACGGTTCTARGTDTFIYGQNAPGETPEVFSGVAGSDVLAQKVHAELVGDLKKGWDATWKDRGIHTAYFGEINPNNNPETPAILIEVGFHHTAADATQLKEPGFRYTAARAITQGIIKYFAAKDGVAAVLPPEPPVGVFARNHGGGLVELGWRPAQTDGAGIAGDATTGYRLYSSDDGLAWDDGLEVDANGAVQMLPLGSTKYFRVAATNAGGESFPSAIVAVGVPEGGSTAPVLVVNGFDRLDATMARNEAMPNVGTALRVFVEQMNDGTYARQHGLALKQAGFGFDTATVAALDQGTVALGAYPAVDWFVGRGETIDGGLSQEHQGMIRAFVEAGGRLILSGTNVASTLAMGDATDTAFLAEVMHAASTGGASASIVNGTTGGVLEGWDGVVLDDGWQGAYPAGVVDALGPAGGALQIAELDGTASGAAVLSPAPSAVAFLSFPFETVVGASTRAELMGRLLTALEVPEEGYPYDGGLPDLDGGVNPGMDAGVDAGTQLPDAGMSGGDAGSMLVTIPLIDSEYQYADAGGCGCGAGGAEGAVPLMLIGAFVTFAWRRRRAQS